MLNETIELHQAEIIALKSDLNTIATRMDYQYSDRFRSIEENIESTQNKVKLFFHQVIIMIYFSKYVTYIIVLRNLSRNLNPCCKIGFSINIQKNYDL